ncbi:MAG: fused MFS/spermidine synthase [Gammaproteobacteria bacterium]|nr:fused MFS/spermidine synthase [Gammaproteobacteria bacterium]NNL45938.1 fused MFS/spermidine synthase [Woeseiaceae bacterium]
MVWTLGNRLLFTAIFISGASALIYQLIWVRLLGLVFGVGSFAVATVVAVFLLGLGLGSFFFGRWSERARDPLRIYLYVELGIAATSLIAYLVIEAVPVYRYLYEYAYNNLGFYGLSVARLLLSMFVLLPPVFLIGGTMPLLAKYFLRDPANLGSSFSKIYYLNTLGACAGALLTGFLFVRYFGVIGTLMIAVGGNFAVALIIALSKRGTGATRPATGEQSPYSYMLVFLFLTGFISLGYEMLWVRILSTYGLSTSQAFALILAGFLLGFSVGAWAVARKVDRRRDLEAWFSAVSIVTALSGAVVLLLFRKFEAITIFLADATPMNQLTLGMAFAFTVSFIPAVFMGILFPLGVRIYARDVDRIGAKAGNTFFSNTLGCVLGSLLTGFVLIPFLGMWNTTLLLINLSLLIAVAFLLRGRRPARAQWASLVVVAAVANLLVFTDSKTFHAELKGRDLRTAAEGFDVIYYAEGLSGTVTAVERGNYRGLFVDGQNVSGTDPVLLADSKMLAHVPLLLAEDPEVALTVGFGTGTTSGSMLLYDVEVHAVEIEKKIIEAAPLFSNVNYASYADPDLNIVLDDARNYIATTDTKFSVIVTDVTNLKYKRNPYLYTREYFEIMRGALSADGVAAAWLPVGGLSFNDLRTLIATFDNVFPHTTAWYFTQFPTHFIILVGTPEPTRVNLAKLGEKMARVERDLQSLNVDNVYKLASMLLLGESDIDSLVHGAPIHTDNRPILEYSDMDLYNVTDVAPNLGRLIEFQQEDLLACFVGTENQLAELEEYFELYTGHYRDYVRLYEQQRLD